MAAAPANSLARLGRELADQALQYARLMRLDERQAAHALATALIMAAPGAGHHAAPTTARWLDHVRCRVFIARYASGGARTCRWHRPCSFSCGTPRSWQAAWRHGMIKGLFGNTTLPYALRSGLQEATTTHKAIAARVAGAMDASSSTTSVIANITPARVGRM